jgi:hypothetical protein
VLVCDGVRPLRAFAQRAKNPVPVVPAPGEPLPGEPDIHINNVNAGHSPLKERMRRFHPVATRTCPTLWACAPPPNQSIHKAAGYPQPWAQGEFILTFSEYVLVTHSCLPETAASGGRKRGGASCEARPRQTDLYRRGRERRIQAGEQAELPQALENPGFVEENDIWTLLRFVPPGFGFVAPALLLLRATWKLFTWLSKACVSRENNFAKACDVIRATCTDPGRQ